jgi:two-component system sensor histidine kinase KdpD
MVLERGRLKVYLGPASGAGKTCRMLEDARRAKNRGVDVVVAFVDTRGRPEGETLLAGLEAVPPRTTEYRGMTVDEMDLEAVLARKPRLAVVDELAHTNVPGSRNKKRYQDVLTLLEAGIDVVGAVNVRHLESLNELVEKTTGAAVRETIPDSFLKEAQVVNVDAAVDDLAEGIFTPQHLSSLRELALRETAERVESARASSVNRRVMVGLSSNPARALTLLRRGSRMAGRLNTDWYAVYVETSLNAPEEALATAKEWGAQVARLKGREAASALMDFARAHGVGHIVVGRSPLPWWRRFFKKSVLLRLMEEADDVDLHVVALEEEA